MMTERENALKVYNHEIPEWIPNLFDSFYFVGVMAGNECGQRGEKIDEVTALDCFGIPWTFADGTPMPAENSALTDDITEWKEVVKIPDPDTWDWEDLAKAELANYDGTKLLTYFCEEGLFDRLRDIMGFEDAMCALLTDPETCSEFFEAIADYKIKIVKNVAKYYKPDVFMYTDDIAKSDSLFMKPDTYRELIKPQQARIIKAIRDSGMIAEQHTCGKCEAVIPDYVEIGVQSFFPAQASNDLVRIKKEFGDKLIINGGFNSQGPCGRPDASEETMRAEARRMIDQYGKGGGYLAVPIILGGVHFSIMDLDTQKQFYDEFTNYSKDFYNKPENLVL